ncbi:MAG: aldo/keto reductase [Candidatus Kapabacteria bacterium]|nr:aldo/keto reductase [Candidatus Kapabacteria bacterium]
MIDTLSPTRTGSDMAGGLGFGCYRVSQSDPVHDEAMRQALAHGVDMVDTSSNYSNGKSEMLVGTVLASIPEAKRPTVVTKLGYIQGDMLDLAKARASMGDELADVVKLSDSAWHCIHPDFLEEALSTSFERIGITPIDVVLLHNPEYYLQIAHQSGTSLDEARTEFYRRIELAFAWLERAVTDGRIKSYGISSNTFANATDAPDAVSLELCFACAERVGNSGHHFTTAQMPMNVVEHGAATTTNQAGGTSTTLERAVQLGVKVIVNRPLNAIVDSDLIRLVSHPMPSHIVHPDDVEQRIHALETIEHDLVNSIMAGGSLSERETQVAQEAFRIAGALCSAWTKFQGLPHWRDVRATYLDPRLEAAAMFADRAPDPAAVHSYLHDVEHVLIDIDVVYAAEENASLEELRQILADEFGMPIDTPLQHIAVQSLRCTPGVDHVLVGMRRPEYVEDILSVFELPEPTYHRATWQRVAEHLARLSQ